MHGNLAERSHTGPDEHGDGKNEKVVFNKEQPDAQVAQMMQQSEEELDTFADMAGQIGTLSPGGSVSQWGKTLSNGATSPKAGGRPPANSVKGNRLRL